MSNLKLPPLDYASLYARFTPNDSDSSSYEVKLGYETTATLYHGIISIRHHGSVIASLAPDSLWLSTAGYDSITTTARLHKILVDSGLWPVAFGCAIRNRQPVIITSDDMRHGILPVGNPGVYFSRTDGEWELVNDPRMVTK